MKTPLPTFHSSKTDALPVPDADALLHTHACAAHIREEIVASGGQISFARFMELALYAPGLGYYSAGARKFGAEGDFVTAPEISALFGQCLSRAIALVITETKGSVLELGPGSGKLAWDMLLALDELNALPEKYLLLEVSADLIQRQRERLAKLPAHIASRLEWIGELPNDFAGAMVANEVLDVLPVHLLHWTNYKTKEQAHERCVALEDEQFVWRDSTESRMDIGVWADRIAANYLNGRPPDNYVSEICPAAPALIQALAKSLKQGAMIFIDYGFRAAEYYHPSRISGTLMCHYRHYAHTDPFRYPGLQDITSHVDFTAVAEAGTQAGLELAGYTTQAQFLIACGITDLLSQTDPQDAAKYLPLTNQAQRLLSPAEMGEFFKVIGFSKDLIEPMDVFQQARQLPL